MIESQLQDNLKIVLIMSIHRLLQSYEKEQQQNEGDGYNYSTPIGLILSQNFVKGFLGASKAGSELLS